MVDFELKDPSRLILSWADANLYRYLEHCVLSGISFEYMWQPSTPVRFGTLELHCVGMWQRTWSE